MNSMWCAQNDTGRELQKYFNGFNVSQIFQAMHRTTYNLQRNIGWRWIYQNVKVIFCPQTFPIISSKSPNRNVTSHVNTGNQKRRNGFNNSTVVFWIITTLVNTAVFVRDSKFQILYELMIELALPGRTAWIWMFTGGWRPDHSLSRPQRYWSPDRSFFLPPRDEQRYVQPKLPTSWKIWNFGI